MLIGKFQVCSAARKGSPYDVAAIADALRDGRIRPRLLNTCVAALVDGLPHLTRECRRTEDPTFRSAMESCLTTLWRLKDNFFETRKSLEKKLFAALPHLSAWVVQTLKDVEESRSNSQDDFFKPISFAVDLVQRNVHDSPEFDKLLQADDTLRMITRVWLRPPPKVAATASNILYQIFTGHACNEHSVPLYAAKRRTMLEIASDMGLGAGDVMELALTRIGSSEGGRISAFTCAACSSYSDL